MTSLASRGLRPAAELAVERPHGDRLRYMAGCRCFQCRRANSDYERQRKAARLAGDWNGLVPATLLEYASRIKNRAVRRLGELSRQQEKVERCRTDLHPDAGKQTKTAVLSAAGVSTSAANRAELVSHIPEEEFDRLVDGPSPPTVTQLAEIGSQRKRESEQRPPRSGQIPGSPDEPLTAWGREARSQCSV